MIPQQPISAEEYKKVASLGKFLIRDQRQAIGAGVILTTKVIQS
jgi:translation elongation factor EF-1alpha